MEPSNIKIFKLNYSGTFEEVYSDKILDLFSLINILAVYVSIQKRMYIWIGKNSAQSLKKHIASTRALFLKQFPDLKILRNITIESGSEPTDFFQFIGFTWEDLRTHLENEEKRLTPLIKEINNLKTIQNTLIESEKFEDAIEPSEKIIELAQQINDDALKSEQIDLIEELKEKAKFKIDIDKVKEEASNIKEEFDTLIKSNLPSNIIKAHEIVSHFKKKYENLVNLNKISIIKKMISEEDRIWNNLLSDQQYSTKELDKLYKKIKNSIENHDILEAENFLTTAKDLLLRVTDETKKSEWNKIETDLLELKLKSDAIGKIEKSIVKSRILMDKFQFKEAISNLESTIELLQDKDVLQYNKKLKDLKEQLLKSEHDYIKIKEEISSLEEKIKDNRENNHFNAGIINCEKIIKNAEMIKSHDIVFTYKQILEDLREKQQKLQKEQMNEIEELKEKAKDLENVIKIDQDIQPIIEDFSVDETLGDLPKDINEILEQLGELLKEHRVVINQEISNHTLLKSSSEEIIESTKQIEVRKSEDTEKHIKYNIHSGIINPFNDSIEEALIKDLIPYNYELINVSLNGQPPKEFPEKLLTKEGLKLEWKIHNIPSKENIDIIYDLRPRISRTIIFLRKNKVKIIKTHNALKKLEIEGLFEAQMPITNSFGDVLNGAIVEDIIPHNYFYFIKEPQNLKPTEMKDSQLGDLIKWNVGILNIETINYQYRLLEMYRMEDIKKNVFNLSTNGLNALNKGDLTETLEVYEKIINELEEFNK